VAIYRYVTAGSFDAYMWQALETKARFIAQVLTGDNTVRQAEDIGVQELSYAEVKAIASGNPAVLTLAEADAALHQLRVLQKHYADEQFLARRQLRALPADITRLERRLVALTQDSATAEAHATAPVTIGTQPYGRHDALEAALSSTAQEGADASRTLGGTLVERLKTLQAAHTLDAAPERVAPRPTATVAEAITTRIRQREQADTAPQQADQLSPVAPALPVPPPSTAPEPPATPVHAHPEPWTPPQQLRLF
jgi:hypothetical protein